MAGVAQDRETSSTSLQSRDTFVQSRGIGRYVAVGALFLVVVVGIVYALSGRTDPDASVKKESPTPTPKVMIYVEGGKYRIGRNNGDEYERPAHDEDVDPFYIDKEEVTCEEFRQFVEQTKRSMPDNWFKERCPPNASGLPVTGVSWDDANAYADWAYKRLPTEVEWEVAARGRTEWLYPWGNDWNTDKANVGKSEANGRAEPVGAYAMWPSPTGALNMSGNVWEWTANPIHSYAGGRIPEDNFPEAQRKAMRVVRGGCYLSNSWQATATYRRGWPPPRGGNFDQTGFRCARDAQK